MATGGEGGGGTGSGPGGGAGGISAMTSRFEKAKAKTVVVDAGDMTETTANSLPETETSALKK